MAVSRRNGSGFREERYETLLFFWDGKEMENILEELYDNVEDMSFT